MRTIKRLLLVLLIGLLFGILFRGPIFRKIIQYETIGKRSNTEIKNERLIQIINGKNLGKNDLDNIIRTSLQITAQQLSFTSEKCETNTNKLVDNSKTNCIGYANYFSSVFNYLAQKNLINKTWKAETHIGKIKLFNINIHQFLVQHFLRIMIS